MDRAGGVASVCTSRGEVGEILSVRSDGMVVDVVDRYAKQIRMREMGKKDHKICGRRCVAITRYRCGNLPFLYAATIRVATIARVCLSPVDEVDELSNIQILY